VFIAPIAGWSGARTQNATLALSPAGVSGAGLGGSVSISANGGTVATGAATQTDGSNPDEGGAYLFSKPPAGWSGTVGQSLTLIPSDGLAGDQFGSSVAISGSTVVSGAPDRQVGFNAGLGIAYVFGFPAPAITITSPGDGRHGHHLQRLAGDWCRARDAHARDPRFQRVVVVVGRRQRHQDSHLHRRHPTHAEPAPADPRALATRTQARNDRARRAA
jgi:hypothetical protein